LKRMEHENDAGMPPGLHESTTSQRLPVCSELEMKNRLQEALELCRASKPRDAFAMIEECDQYASAQEEPIHRVHVLNAEAMCWLEVADYGRAIARCKEALRPEWVPRIPPRVQGQIQLGMGRAWLGEGERFRAMECFVAAEKCAHKALERNKSRPNADLPGMRLLLLEVNYELGVAYEETNRLKEAKEYFIKVATIGQQTNNESEDETLMRLAAIYHCAPSSSSVGGAMRIWRVLAWEALKGIQQKAKRETSKLIVHESFIAH